VKTSEIEQGGGIPPYSDTVAFNKSDWNVLVDAQIRIWKQLKFNVRFAYSLVPIRERIYYDVRGKIEEPWTGSNITTCCRSGWCMFSMKSLNRGCRRSKQSAVGSQRIHNIQSMTINDHH